MQALRVKIEAIVIAILVGLNLMIITTPDDKKAKESRNMNLAQSLILNSLWSMKQTIKIHNELHGIWSNKA